ncbi:Hypothetical protein CINCED_3A007971 [Cinara cedri]|uniref:Uncharacterized protein n=1 Tax=Cinara cedri TaxID=506608 RepID=A0A5E4M499_9HEMI|nr:Hypothetical protein CINCED_3A007971 [Cinara cedri]
MVKKQKLVVTNSSSTTTLESENEDLNIGLDIDITTQKSVENIVDKNVISDLGTLIIGPVCYKQEQMALCVRYVKNLYVVERFLGFIDCSKNQDAESLYHYILWYPKKYKLLNHKKLLSHMTVQMLCLGNLTDYKIK